MNKGNWEFYWRHNFFFLNPFKCSQGVAAILFIGFFSISSSDRLIDNYNSFMRALINNFKCVDICPIFDSVKLEKERQIAH